MAQEDALMVEFESDPNLQELCLNNGLSQKQFVQRASSVTCLDMFLGDWSQMQSVRHFTNITSLTIIQQRNLTTLEGLDSCPLLDKLWVIECSLKRIEGLEKCVQLTELNLSSNSICKIENLGKLTRLKTLWLNYNNISTLQGLESLENLEQLWICGNTISEIGTQLSRNVNLIDLNLSENQIGCFKEILELDRLAKLQVLSFSDPHFGENPVCHLCNYRTFVVCQLLKLKSLDAMLILPEHQRIAQATLMKKKMYYNMRIKTLKRNVGNILQHANLIQETSMKPLQQLIRQLEYQKMNAARELEQGQWLNGEIEPSREAELQEQYDSVSESITEHYETIAQIVSAYQTLRSSLSDIVETTISRLCLELHTGGNIRLEDGTVNEVWYHSCVELIQSRLFLSSFRPFGIGNIKICRITRIHNRFLRNRFEKALKSKNVKVKAREKAMEYLFYTGQDTLSVAEAGFESKVVELSNSVALAELPQITRVMGGDDVITRDAFLAKDLPAFSTTMTSCKHSISVGSFQLPRGKVIITKAFLGDHFEKQTKVDDPKQSVFTTNADEFTLPEYIVEFEYMASFQTSSGESRNIDAIQSELTELNEKFNSGSDGSLSLQAFSEQERIDLGPIEHPIYTFVTKVNGNTSARVNMIQEESVSEKSSLLTASRLLSYSKQVDFEQVIYLNLADTGLETIENLDLCRNLQVLTLSFNSIRVMGDCFTTGSCCQLKQLDLSYNQLERVTGLETLDSLMLLNLNTNRIDQRMEFPPALQQLDLRNNPIWHWKSYRKYILERIDTLSHLDGKSIPRSASEIESTTILTCPDEDCVEIRQLHASLCDISSIRNCIYLRKLSLADNDIQEIQGLEYCTLLEELNLEDNRIRDLKPLQQLKQLRVLDIGKNEIQTLEPLKDLIELEQVSADDNCLSNVTGVSNLMKLMELYIGNNEIEDLRQIQQLKTLSKLIILDVSGNTICCKENFRFYTIYYLRRLKVLDGKTITTEEQDEAKEKYSGKLTTEFLIEKIGEQFNRVQELELSCCRIREIESLNGCKFSYLKELILNQNFLTDILGLEQLDTLRILRLNHNRIETLLDSGILACPNLTTLELSFNRIEDMTKLGLHHLPQLQVLNLAGNLIKNVSGLNFNFQLKHLNLSKNKIKLIEMHSVSALDQMENLQLDENAIRTLNHLETMTNLKVLSLQGNRLNELQELDKLKSLDELTHLHLLSNPIAKKQLYRATVVNKLPQLKILDQKAILLEERERVEMIFSPERQNGGYLNEFLQTPTPAVNPKFKSSVNVGKTSYVLSPSTRPHHSAGDEIIPAPTCRSLRSSRRRSAVDKGASSLSGGGRRIAHQKMRSSVRDSSSTSRYF